MKLLKELSKTMLTRNLEGLGLISTLICSMGISVSPFPIRDYNLSLGETSSMCSHLRYKMP